MQAINDIMLFSQRELWDEFSLPSELDSPLDSPAASHVMDVDQIVDTCRGPEDMIDKLFDHSLQEFSSSDFTSSKAADSPSEDYTSSEEHQSVVVLPSLANNAQLGGIQKTGGSPKVSNKALWYAFGFLMNPYQPRDPFPADLRHEIEIKSISDPIRELDGVEVLDLLVGRYSVSSMEPTLGAHLLGQIYLSTKKDNFQGSYIKRNGRGSECKATYDTLKINEQVCVKYVYRWLMCDGRPIQERCYFLVDELKPVGPPLYVLHYRRDPAEEKKWLAKSNPSILKKHRPDDDSPDDSNEDGDDRRSDGGGSRKRSRGNPGSSSKQGGKGSGSNKNSSSGTVSNVQNYQLSHTEPSLGQDQALINSQPFLEPPPKTFSQSQFAQQDSPGYSQTEAQGPRSLRQEPANAPMYTPSTYVQPQAAHDEDCQYYEMSWIPLDIPAIESIKDVKDNPVQSHSQLTQLTQEGSLSYYDDPSLQTTLQTLMEELADFRSTQKQVDSGQQQSEQLSPGIAKFQASYQTIISKWIQIQRTTTSTSSQQDSYLDGLTKEVHHQIQSLTTTFSFTPLPSPTPPLAASQLLSQLLFSVLPLVCGIFSICGINNPPQLFIFHSSQVIDMMKTILWQCQEMSRQFGAHHDHRQFLWVGETGEGKSVAVAVTAALFALLGYEDHCCTGSSQRDSTMFQPFFSRLGLNNDQLLHCSPAGDTSSCSNQVQSDGSAAMRKRRKLFLSSSPLQSKQQQQLPSLHSIDRSSALQSLPLGREQIGSEDFQAIDPFSTSYSQAIYDQIIQLTQSSSSPGARQRHRPQQPQRSSVVCSFKSQQQLKKFQDFALDRLEFAGCEVEILTSRHSPTEQRKAMDRVGVPGSVVLCTVDCEPRLLVSYRDKPVAARGIFHLLRTFPLSPDRGEEPWLSLPSAGRSCRWLVCEEDLPGCLTDENRQEDHVDGREDWNLSALSKGGNKLISSTNSSEEDEDIGSLMDQLSLSSSSSSVSPSVSLPSPSPPAVTADGICSRLEVDVATVLAAEIGVRSPLPQWRDSDSGGFPRHLCRPAGMIFDVNWGSKALGNNPRRTSSDP